jgi:small-conductance mechanosensitive channel
VKPILNGFIVLIALALLYPIVSSFLKGMIAFSNMKLKQGDVIKINNQEGRISDVSLSGIKLHTGSNNIYIPFGQLADNIVERYQKDQTQYLCFICEPKDENTKLSMSVVERLVFNFPFLEHKSNIEIIQLDNKIKVNLSIANNRFRSSLLEQFKTAGYKVEISKK